MRKVQHFFFKVLNVFIRYKTNVFIFLNEIVCVEF